MATGRNALHIVLQESNLLEYEPLLLEEGTGRDRRRRQGLCGHRRWGYAVAYNG